MNQTEIENDLKAILQLKPGSVDTLRNRESSQIEFKESFNLGSKSKYARTMAAYANTRGGYIVFGVKPSPHLLIGVNIIKFEQTDSSKVTEYLNACLSPELNWQMGIVNIFGFKIGYIFTQEAREKPILCTQNSGDDLKDGHIYYRYNAQTTAIRYPELRRIMEERLAKERRAWLQHFKAISKAGPTNVGILDTIHGKIYGAGTPFLIDEKLLRELKFVREGTFSDLEGLPTLRLVGEVRSVSGVGPVKRVAVSIHADDLITAFLAQRHLDPDDAKMYLQEASHQPTHFMPIHYFIAAAKLSQDDAIQLLKSVVSPFKATKVKLIKRISGIDFITPVGTLNFKCAEIQGLNKDTFEAKLSECRSEAERRALILTALKAKPSLMRDLIAEIPPVRLFEAITHIEYKDIEPVKDDLLDLMLYIFTDLYRAMSSGEQSMFRKAVAYLDELLKT